MSVNLFMKFNGKYIFITPRTDYELTPGSLKKFWLELSTKCLKHKCRKAIIEGPAPKRLITSMDAFESGFQTTQSIPNLMLAICLSEYIPEVIANYFTTIAYNRGVRIEFFKDKKKALEWLNSNDARTPS